MEQRGPEAAARERQTDAALSLPFLIDPVSPFVFRVICAASCMIDSAQQQAEQPAGLKIDHRQALRYSWRSVV
jgi:hypothetical protein